MSSTGSSCRIPVLPYDPIDADRDTSRSAHEHACDILRLCQRLSTQGSAFGVREDLDHTQLPMLRFAETVISALPTEFSTVTTSMRNMWQQTSQKVVSDNCFTIVEGINPGAEVLPPVLMKGSSTNVGTPVEQIVLADSNCLPENGLFEIRDTRTGRRIHPSELPFTLTFTPYSSSIPPFSKYYGPITAKEFEATKKAEEYNERKRKYEESNYAFYEGCGAPIYRPPKLPSDADENMDFLTKCMKEDRVEKDKAALRMMVKFERPKALRKLRKRRRKLRKSEDQGIDEEGGVSSTQLADGNQGTQERSGTKKQSARHGAPAIKPLGSVAELLLARKNRKKLPFSFRRPRLFRGMFRNYNGYANLRVKSIAKKAALTSIYANVLDTSPSTALLTPSPPSAGSTEAATSSRAGSTPPVTNSTPFSPSGSISSWPTTNAEASKAKQAHRHIVTPPVGTNQASPISSQPPETSSELFGVSFTPTLSPAETASKSKGKSLKRARESDGGEGDEVNGARPPKRLSPSPVPVSDIVEGKNRARDEDGDHVDVDEEGARPTKRVCPIQS